MSTYSEIDYEFDLKHVTSCLNAKCNYSVTTLEKSCLLILPIKSTLKRKKETINGNCNECKGTVLKKKTVIESTLSVLVIQLNLYTFVNGASKKINDNRINAVPSDFSNAIRIPPFLTTFVNPTISAMVGYSGFHVPSKDNPADCSTSRGLSADELSTHSLWWIGPKWLTESSTSWSSHDVSFSPDHGTARQISDEARETIILHVESEDECNGIYKLSISVPPNKWELPRIQQIHPGSDGLVRVVTIRTALSLLKQPITQLCKLPINCKSSVSETTD
ncbi:hypothetical protein ALC57_08275 [Trachymyrmex cornetzi]|uniref:DUF5641 domain-containing protein n=1 Tax=Trachymyrmex cornetzi TaxID=471704 RepID=A0A151J7C7_9HYME|nr:hypothetical protein ALC57_08275 [Trachymyrmex cornetzi]